MNKIIPFLLSFFLCGPTLAAPTPATIQLKGGTVNPPTLLPRQPYVKYDPATSIAQLYVGTIDGNKLLFNGIVGATGPAGAKGEKGDTGATGASGLLAATSPLTYSSTTKTVSISPATNSSAGSMSAADKTKLDSIGVTIMKEAIQPVPALTLLAAPVDLTFTFAAPFPSTAYSWYLLPLGGITLGNLTITEKSRTASTLVLTIKNSGLAAISLGSSLKVTAYTES